MTKTPDEIKKGLECCSISYADCNSECPYKRDCDGSQILKDALALIQQLEVDKQQLEGMLTHMNQLRDAAAGRALKMEERVRQLEAERDAAVACLKKAANEKGECFGCKWYNGKNCTHPDYKTLCSWHDDKWEWRGVQKEDGNA